MLHEATGQYGECDSRIRLKIHPWGSVRTPLLTPDTPRDVSTIVFPPRFKTQWRNAWSTASIQMGWLPDIETLPITMAHANGLALRRTCHHHHYHYHHYHHHYCHYRHYTTITFTTSITIPPLPSPLLYTLASNSAWCLKHHSHF